MTNQKDIRRRGPFRRELEVAVAAVREAAALTRAVQTEIPGDAVAKKDKSPVTVADFGSQALVCRALYEAFPGVAIVAEEDTGALVDPDNAALLHRVVDYVGRVRPYTDAGDVVSWIEWGRAGRDPMCFWTLDPIDGTKGFLRGEQYAISLALVVEGKLAAAAVCCPNLSSASGGRGAVLFAAEGTPAFEVGLEEGAAPRPVRVSGEPSPARLRFVESVETAHSSHDDAAAIARALRIQAEPVRMDSQAKYAVVARGDAEAYLRLPKDRGYEEKIWDHAGGALVVAAAGGRVTDILGRPLAFDRGETLKDNSGAIVSNGLVHDAILEAIRSLGIGAEREPAPPGRRS